MKELFYTSPYKIRLHTIRIEYGEIGEKFVLKVFEGEINFKGDFEVTDDVMYRVGPEDADTITTTVKDVDDILGGNIRVIEEYTTGTSKKTMTKGEKVLEEAELRMQSEVDQARDFGDVEFATGGKVGARPPTSGPASGGLPSLLNNGRPF